MESKEINNYWKKRNYDKSTKGIILCGKESK